MIQAAHVAPVVPPVTPSASSLHFVPVRCYGGKSWGKDQFGLNGRPAPLNRADQVSFNHDRDYVHATWVMEGWSVKTPGVAPGIVGIAYVLIGTGPFSVAGALQGPGGP
jgi:hypothetical protein